MNYLVQRGKLRQQTISVPDGLPELLSDITREVLRCQPTKECLCQFIIDYLHSVILTREKAMAARSILERALRRVDESIAEMCICDMTKEQSDLLAGAMETCFRTFLERRRCEARRAGEIVGFDQLDLLEELLAKCKLSPAELEKARPAIESAYKRFVDVYMAAAETTDGTEILYQYLRDRELKRTDDMIREKAATKIQSVFRGYLVRSSPVPHTCTCTCMLDEKVDDELNLKLDRAARIIQRFFRSLVREKDESVKIEDDPCERKSLEVTETTEIKTDDIQGEEPTLTGADTVVTGETTALDMTALDASAAITTEEEAPDAAVAIAPELEPTTEPEPAPPPSEDVQADLPTEEIPQEEPPAPSAEEAPEAPPVEEAAEAPPAEEAPEAPPAEEAPDAPPAE